MKVLITAGGTGGHIMPAIAIAEAICEIMPGAKILFVGTDRGMEERIARLKGLDFISIKAMGIKGKSLTNLLTGHTSEPEGISRRYKDHQSIQTRMGYRNRRVHHGHGGPGRQVAGMQLRHPGTEQHPGTHQQAPCQDSPSGLPSLSGHIV